MAGSYYVRLTSNDRVSGTLNAFRVDVSGHPQLQEISGLRVHTVSFPNIHPNVSPANSFFAIGSYAGGLPLYYSAEDIPAGTVFRAAIVPWGGPGGIWRTSAPLPLIPRGTLMSDVATILTVAMQTDPAWNFANAFFSFIPNLGAPRFAIDYPLNGPWQIILAPQGTANASDDVLYRVLGLYDTIGAIGVPTLLNILGPANYLTYRLVQVPPGQYTATEFATALQTTVLAEFPTSGFAVVLENENFRPRFHMTSTEPLRFFSVRDTGGDSSLSRIVGISDGSNVWVTDFVAQLSPNLQGLSVVSLQSQSIAMSRCVQAREDEFKEPAISISTVTEVPVSHVEWGGWVSYQPPTDQDIYYSGYKNLQSLEFTLRDPTSRGELIELCEPGVHILLQVLTS